MPSDRSSDVKLEIGHVLFIDIVGYSKLLITEQSDQLQTLKAIVRVNEEVRKAEAEGKLIRLPTGDGGALVFRNHPEAPVLCALEISKALKSHPELKVRMGIHSGPVNEITDLNEQANIAGDGINIAQRVMDCGDADICSPNMWRMISNRTRTAIAPGGARRIRSEARGAHLGCEFIYRRGRKPGAPETRNCYEWIALCLC